MYILIMSLSKGFHYHPLTIYSLVICPAIGGAHGGRADCKGVAAQEAFSLMAGRSDDETTLGPNFFGLAQNKHEHAVSTARDFY